MSAAKQGTLPTSVSAGAAYRYMIRLDADSVAGGTTLVEMTSAWNRTPRSASSRFPHAGQQPLLVRPLPAVCTRACTGRCFGEASPGGRRTRRYWGHNAIIRVAPFIHHCGLSALPGGAATGGEVPSHDFVEAALNARRAKVCLAHDLDGSFEESPPTLIDYARRDRRWCQGNMQHIRLVFQLRAGAHEPPSPGNGCDGVPILALWLSFLLLSFLWSRTHPWIRQHPGTGGSLCRHGELAPVAQALGLSLAPSRSAAPAAAAGKAFASILIESIVSILVAPIAMAFMPPFVLSTLLGVRVAWNAQPRCERGQRFQPALSTHWKQTVAGLAAAGRQRMLGAAMLPWLSPVLVGLILAIPLSMLLSVAAGQAATPRTVGHRREKHRPESCANSDGCRAAGRERSRGFPGAVPPRAPTRRCRPPSRYPAGHGASLPADHGRFARQSTSVPAPPPGFSRRIVGSTLRRLGMRSLQRSFEKAGLRNPAKHPSRKRE